MAASKEMLKRINKILEPKSIAVVGASQAPEKVGHVIVRNLIEGRYGGKVYPVNPKYDKLLGMKCYHSVLDVPGNIDCVIIATPAPTIPAIMEECAKKKVGGVLMLSGGFEEVGRRDLADAVRKIAETNSIPTIGPNCLGVFNPYNHVDSIFFPMYKLGRPGPGNVSFITQSGAVGSVIIDAAGYYGIGIAKFISYGNATVLDETDLLGYLAEDRKTEIIIFYLEAVKDGRRLLAKMTEVNKKKPILVLKAGRGAAGQSAALSHTGNIAGSYLAYQAAFRQAKVTEARSIDELFDLMRIFGQPPAMGKKMGVITNGGGLGVLTIDAVEEEGLAAAGLGEETIASLKKVLPSYGNIGNPLDLIADATVELYEKAIEEYMKDGGVDFIIICVLFQTPPMNERIVNVLVNAAEDKRKPIAVVSVGGAYTESYKKILESRGVPTFGSPNSAVKAIRKFIEYSKNMQKYTRKPKKTRG
ncbi:CoA-binding protein [Candidatus Micrarchaeota archaeon]|nr:CoA-binding protein [Candidatus Micrarchaeota archaeon]